MNLPQLESGFTSDGVVVTRDIESDIAFLRRDANGVQGWDGSKGTKLSARFGSPVPE